VLFVLRRRQVHTAESTASCMPRSRVHVLFGRGDPVDLSVQVA
jgi:hypothetical protein